MARGHGSQAPKDPGQRRRYNQPARGEWVDLEPLEKPVLPAAEEEWSDAAKRLWAAWRQDPVTSQYGEADQAAVYELARLYDDLAPNEQRLRMDGLGLTPKGKRDLRWRTPAEVEAAAKQGAKVQRLRVVADAVAGS
jgi:hypothetical protein